MNKVLAVNVDLWRGIIGASIKKKTTRAGLTNGEFRWLFTIKITCVDCDAASWLFNIIVSTMEKDAKLQYIKFHNCLIRTISAYCCQCIQLPITTNIITLARTNWIFSLWVDTSFTRATQRVERRLAAV